MNNQEIVNYVMNTPGNTNPAILNQMLNENKAEKWDLIIEHFGGFSGDGTLFGDIKGPSEKDLAKAFQKVKRHEPVRILYQQRSTDGEEFYGWYYFTEVPLLSVSCLDQGDVIAYGSFPYDVEGMVNLTMYFKFNENSYEISLTSGI